MTYFERWITVKPRIIADEDLLKRVRTLFEHHYVEGWPDSRLPLRIAGGTNHELYWIGNVQKNVALRLAQRPYEIGSERLLREVAAFDKAFYDGKKVPNFVGVITYKSFAALVTEDLSEGGKMPLQDSKSEIHVRKNADGSISRFFVINYFTFLIFDRCLKKR